MLRQSLYGEVDAKPGDLVMDFCAGSGGKVPLALQCRNPDMPLPRLVAQALCIGPKMLNRGQAFRSGLTILDYSPDLGLKSA